MSNALPSNLLRFWTDSRAAYEDGVIRIEWASKDGVRHTTMGRYYQDDNCVVWDYEEPTSNRIYNLAAECAASAGDWEPAGSECMGVETRQQMEHAVESCCVACGLAVGAPDELSELGHCVPCFCEHMATSGVVPAAPLALASESNDDGVCASCIAKYPEGDTINNLGLSGMVTL